MDGGDIAQWVVTICVVIALFINMRRNTKADTNQASKETSQAAEQKNEIKHIIQRLDDPNDGLGAIKRAITKQELHCRQISTELTGRIRESEEDIQQLRKDIKNHHPHKG
jgi:tRNA C32,U32 (ribose-2'-O)-methylase TrmJ